MAITETTQTVLERHLSSIVYAPPWKVALAYLIVFTIAELLITYVNPIIGTLIHVLILITLIIHAALIPKTSLNKLLVTLLLIPLIRLISLTLPLFLFDIAYWYLIVSIPLIISAIVVVRILGFSRNDIGIQFRKPHYQIGVILCGVAFGIAEFLILHPEDSIVPSLTLTSLLIASISLFIGTGLMEELIFRGIIQTASEPTLGKWGSILFTSLLFAVMHIGWQSAADLVFVFLVGLTWGYVYNKTRSIVGIAISHAFTNLLLFVILPFIFPN